MLTCYALTHNSRVSSDENVAWLDIAMHDAFLVEVEQGFDKTPGHTAHLVMQTSCPCIAERTWGTTLCGWVVVTAGRRYESHRPHTILEIFDYRRCSAQETATVIVSV